MRNKIIVIQQVMSKRKMYGVKVWHNDNTCGEFFKDGETYTYFYFSEEVAKNRLEYLKQMGYKVEFVSL